MSFASERYGVIDMNSAIERHERLGDILDYHERRAAQPVGLVLAHHGEVPCRRNVHTR